MELARLLLAALLVIMFSGCGTAKCDRMTLKYQDHPDKPTPAKRVVFKCGEKSVEWMVDNPPPARCMGDCFKPQAPEDGDG